MSDDDVTTTKENNFRFKKKSFIFRKKIKSQSSYYKDEIKTRSKLFFLFVILIVISLAYDFKLVLNNFSFLS